MEHDTAPEGANSCNRLRLDFAGPQILFRLLSRGASDRPVYACMYVCMHACMYVCVCVAVCVFVWICVDVTAFLHMHAYVYV